MTYECMCDVAMDILRGYKFTDNINLFDIDDIDAFNVTDDEASLHLTEFLTDYTNAIIKLLGGKNNGY